MDIMVYKSLMKLMKQKSITLPEINGLFYTENINDFFDIVIEFINDNIDELYEDSEFFECYHLFLYTLGNLVKTEDEIYALKNMISKCLKIIKEHLKEYNKHLIAKDKKFHTLSSISNQLKLDMENLDNLFTEQFENENYKIIWFVITVLKNPDYLFRLIENDPDYVNIKSKNNISLFIEIINYYISNLNELSIDDIKYYKRIIVMFLESDNLKLTNEELYDLLENLENNIISASINNKRNISFIINEIERHYTIINNGFRVNAVDYCNTGCPVEIIDRTNDERCDLTHLFTFSIDTVKSGDIDKVLIDDALSIVENIDGTVDLMVHIPDVDYFVKKDSETDKYMRGIGESVYAKGYKTPMLNYDIARMCSLSHGNIRPAITFIIKIDVNGKIIDIDFKKSLVNINYNLTRAKSEFFYKKSKDKALLNALHLAYHFAKLLRKNRGETIGKIRTSSLIMEEFNVLVDLVTADYFHDRGIIFPYKNYLGKRSVRNAEHVSICEEFNKNNNVSEDGRNIVYSIFDIYNRVYYDTKAIGNKSFNGAYVGNVGNPMREYISLETDRLIKDLIISREKNIAYWEDRIERDCIEYTETSAKIKQLYNGTAK